MAKYIYSEKQKARQTVLERAWKKNLENKAHYCACGELSVMWYIGSWACRSCIEKDKAYNDRGNK